MKILVTGATGHFGRKVVRTLLASIPAENLAVSVRDTAKASELKALGVDVRHGDFDYPATLDTAFQGVDRLLIVSTQGDNDTRIKQHLAAVDAAMRAGVGFIAYTSLANADKSTLSLAKVHQETEKAIRETRIPFSFLRNNWYIENETGSFQGVLKGAPLTISAGDGKVGFAARNDYAEAAAKVITSDNHENTVYELSGKPITYEGLALVLSKAISRDVPVQNVDDCTYADIMASAGVPKEIIPFLVDIQSSIRRGALAYESNDLEKLLGRPLTPLSDVVRDIIDGLKA